MAISDFTIEGTAVPAAVLVAEGDTINLALVSTSGVHTVSWSIEASSDSSVAVPTITPGAGPPSGATATYTFPSAGYPFAHRVKCIVNEGETTESVTRGIVGVASTEGALPITIDEEGGANPARHATDGWIGPINHTIALGSPSENSQTGTTYTIDNNDIYKIPVFSNASPIAVTIPNDASSDIDAPAFITCYVENGAGDVTVSAQSPASLAGGPTAIADQLFILWKRSANSWVMFV